MLLALFTAFLLAAWLVLILTGLCPVLGRRRPKEGGSEESENGMEV